MLTVEVNTIEDGRVLQVRVSDTVTGISNEHLQRIFEPFFVRKETGKGRGLGLPIVKSIVDRHGGTINIETEVDQGTTFVVNLPATSGDYTDPSAGISSTSERS